MNLKRALTFGLAILLGIGCGFLGVGFGESRINYPEPDVGFVDGDVLREVLLEASLIETKAWIIGNLALDLERQLEDHETTSD